MRNDEQPQPDPQLSPEDQQAIDRLLGRGFSETDLQPNADEGEQSAQLKRLLGLLGTPVADEEYRESRIDLIELTMHRAQSEQVNPDTLCSEDQLGVDAFVESGFDSSEVPEELHERAERLEAIGSLLTTGTNPDSVRKDDLVISTLGGIQAHIDAERAAMSIENQRGFQLPARWADLVSIAAMFLLAASVILPIMSGMRSSSQRQICFSNMNETANAFGLYTGANRDMLPMATAGFGPTWMDVGTTPERSNSSNLYTLVRNGFAGLEDLACPTNPDALVGEPEPGAWDWNSLDEISYSYRIMPRGGMRASIAEQPVRVVLLADRSPVVQRATRGQPVHPEENSPNHSRNGQHMLLLDGSSRWTDTPILDSRDNIWLPRAIETLIHNERERRGIEILGNEQPGGPTDAFVGP